MQSRSHDQFETREVMSLPVLFPLSFRSSLRRRPSGGSGGPEAVGGWKAAPPRSISNPDALTSCQKLSRWDIWVLGTVPSESRCGARLRELMLQQQRDVSVPHTSYFLLQSSEKSLSSDEEQPFHLLTRPQEHGGSRESNHVSGHVTSEDLIRLTENKSPSFLVKTQ